MQSFDFSPRAAFIRKIEDEPNRDLVFHPSAVELSRGSKIEHPCLALSPSFLLQPTSLSSLRHCAASLRLHSRSDSDYRQIAGRPYFGRDSTVVIHSSGLKSVTTDNQKKGL